MHHISLFTTGTATQDFSTIKANTYTYSISLSKFPEDTDILNLGSVDLLLTNSLATSMRCNCMVS